MKAKDIQIGGRYAARVSGKFVTVRVLEVYETSNWRNRPNWSVVNENTGRKLVFHSAAKFRHPALPERFRPAVEAMSS
jgi:hypothetical protein